MERERGSWSRHHGCSSCGPERALSQTGHTRLKNRARVQVEYGGHVGGSGSEVAGADIMAAHPVAQSVPRVKQDTLG